MKKVALIIGASRGIWRQIAVSLAQNDFRVCVSAKTTTPKDSSDTGLPGDTESLAASVQASGGEVLSVKCDVRLESDIHSTVQACLNHFGRLDFAVYNAGAILWKKVIETPLKRFDLMHQVNVRGAYILVQEILPYFLQQGLGKILLIAPPIYSRFFKGKTPYSITKVGMTVLAHGLANELEGTGVSITTLWPATVIESYVTEKIATDPALMRKPTIFADACVRIAQEPTERLNGQALLDEDYLRSIGVTDFSLYRCDPSKEPPRMMPRQLPSLKVAEENENVLNLSSSKTSKL